MARTSSLHDSGETQVLLMMHQGWGYRRSVRENLKQNGNPTSMFLRLWDIEWGHPEMGLRVSKVRTKSMRSFVFLFPEFANSNPFLRQVANNYIRPVKWIFSATLKNLNSEALMVTYLKPQWPTSIFEGKKHHKNKAEIPTSNIQQAAPFGFYIGIFFRNLKGHVFR